MSVRLRVRIASVLTLVALAASRPAQAEDARCADDRSVRLDDVSVRGLVRTAPQVVTREIIVRPLPARLSRREWALIEARLWNLGIFSQVTTDVNRTSDGRCVAVVDVEERFTLSPLLRYALGGRALMFGLGAEDNNLFGRYLFGSALYEYFDGFHGGELTFKEPRLFDRRREILVQAGRLVRPRPGFADARAAARVELSASSEDDVIRGGLRVDAFTDRFVDPLDGAPRFPPETETIALSPVFRVGRVDTIRIRQSGASLELTPTVARLFSHPSIEGFTQMRGEVMAFALAGERINLATRVRAAVTSDVPEHLLLWVGGLDLLRGFPDNHFGARAYGLVNVELRLTAFDSTWFAVVPALFGDAAAARFPHGGRGADASVGGGVRLLVPKLVGTGLRFDVALPLTSDDPFGPQLSFGVYQFFYGGMAASRW